MYIYIYIYIYTYIYIYIYRRRPARAGEAAAPPALEAAGARCCLGPKNLGPGAENGRGKAGVGLCSNRRR